LLVQTLPPAPSGTQAQPQQSDAVVHGIASATQVAPHRSTPAASGTQTPPQQVSPRSHSAPSGKQHTFAPPRPGAHVMSG